MQLLRECQVSTHISLVKASHTSTHRSAIATMCSEEGELEHFSMA